MARAKRTQRAEARRRYRAANAPIEADRPRRTAPHRPATGRPAGRRPGDDARPGPADGLPRQRSAVVPTAQRARRTWRRCRGSRSTRRPSGCRCSSTVASAILTAVAGSNDARRQPHLPVLRDVPGHRWRVHRRLPAPRAPPGSSASSSASSAAVVLHRPRFRQALPPVVPGHVRRGAAGGRHHGAHLVGDLRRLPRRRGGLVPPLPPAVEPEPEPKPGAVPEEDPEAWRWPDADVRHVAEGPRQALIAASRRSLPGNPAGPPVRTSGGCPPTPRDRTIAGHGSSGRHGCSNERRRRRCPFR